MRKTTALLDPIPAAVLALVVLAGDSSAAGAPTD